MRASGVVLGGGRAFLYPKTVWSPAGGWFNKAPQNWERNTGIAFGLLFAGAVVLHNISSELERRPSPPLRRIPSQSWAVHAEEDDPQLPLR